MEIRREAIALGSGRRMDGSPGFSVGMGWDLGALVLPKWEGLLGLRICHLAGPQSPREPFRGPQTPAPSSRLRPWPAAMEEEGRWHAGGTGREEGRWEGRERPL